jgi:hypothetical protein
MALDYARISRTLQLTNMRRNLLFVSALALFIGSGCWWLGENFGSGRSVSLAFLPPPGQTSTNFTANSSDLQEAVAVVHRVLTDNRLERDDLGPPPYPKPGDYIPYHFPTHATSCGLGVSQNGLTVSFRERQSHTSQAIKQLCADLAKQLKAHFAKKKLRVKVTSS